MTAASLQAASLASLSGIRHAFFTRNGGVSQGLYESLNLGDHVGDQPAAVHANRAIFQRGAFTASDTRVVAAVQAFSFLQLPLSVALALLFRAVASLRANDALMAGWVMPSFSADRVTCRSTSSALRLTRRLRSTPRKSMAFMMSINSAR